MINENPMSWQEPSMFMTFRREGLDQIVMDMCMYDKRRPDHRVLVKNTTMTKGTQEICDACTRKCSKDHQPGEDEDFLRN